MRITPIEIKQKTFQKAFRGYEKQEVQAFLGSLAKEWEKLQADHKELKAKMEQSQEEVNRLREVEDSLFKTLKTAEDTRKNLIEQASKSAELCMKETYIKTETLLGRAKNRVREMLERAENKAAEIVENAQKEIRKMQRDYATIEQHREQLLSSLKILSEDILHKLIRMEKMPSPSPTASFEGYVQQTKRLQEEVSLQTHDAAQHLEKSHPAPPTPEVTRKAPHLKPTRSTQQPVTVPTGNGTPGNKGSFFDELT